MKLFLTSFFLVLYVGVYAQQSDVSDPQSRKDIVSDNLEFRRELNAEFSDPDKSPFPLFLVDEFTEIPFYDIDTNYLVTARFEETSNSDYSDMETSTERKASYRVFGKAYFVLNGDSLSLNVYQSEDAKDGQLFLPFKDLTNGDETYIAGRYIDIGTPNGDRLLIDFNKSYNPYCAYSDRYSCPLVPFANRLEVAIPAGVKYIKHEEGWSEIDESPTYPGGVEALYSQLLKKIKYPKKSRKANKEGVAYIEFIVNQDGHLSDISVIKGFDAECDEVALNAVKQLSSFEPAMKDGKPVRARMIIPISFKL